MSKNTLAWLVHIYTALGGILGFFALTLAAQDKISLALAVLLVTVLIDVTDGYYARKLNISKVLPYFDGAMLDNVIDIFTYAYVPFFIIWKLNILISPIVLVLPLLGALYAYGQKEMKTADNYFLGFPTYWNIVAIYFYLIPVSSFVAAFILAVLTIMCFIPTRYLYPSKNSMYGKFFTYAGLLWMLGLFIALSNPAKFHFLAMITFIYPAIYLALSLYTDYKVRSVNTRR